jgi:hypothetical protein
VGSGSVSITIWLPTKHNIILRRNDVNSVEQSQQQYRSSQRWNREIRSGEVFCSLPELSIRFNEMKAYLSYRAVRFLTFAGIRIAITLAAILKHPR